MAPRRCRCGEFNPHAGRLTRCPACGRVLGRGGPNRELALACLAVLTIAAFGSGVLAALWARSRPAGGVAAGATTPRPPVPPPTAARPTRETPPTQPAGRAPPVVPPPVAASPDPPPVTPRPPAPPVGVLAPEPAGRYRVGESFDQEVTVARRAAFRVLGAGAPQAEEYAFASRLTVEAVRPDGSLAVLQRVEAARLVAADPADRGPLEDALRKARGATFRIAVGPSGEVTGLTGPADPVRVIEGNDLPGGPSLRVWSLLDADGWKELAGLTFFQPPRPLAAGATWSRPLAHSWGSLGSWSGRTVYTAAGRRDGAERVEYAHEMTYRPPAGGGDLPFRVVRADFRPRATGGVIRYDAARGRVTAADEVFRVGGTLTVAAGGAEAAVAVEESQEFRLRIPEPRALEGRPAPR